MGLVGLDTLAVRDRGMSVVMQSSINCQEQS